MNRSAFKQLHHNARRAGHSMIAVHNGRRWSVMRDVARLDDNWRFDRPAAAERAMQLDMIAFMRRKYRILSTALIQNREA